MIRTYTRRPQECRYIEGVTELCRLCLQRVDEAVPIFTEDPVDVCSSLALRVMMCVGLEITRDDSLPNNMCTTCYKELEHYYAFRKKCEVSHQKLKMHLQALRNRQSIVAITRDTEEKLKQIDAESQEQEEDVNVDELGLTAGSEESFRILQIEPEPAIEVQSDIPVETKESKVKTVESPPSVKPVDLGSMIAAVLVKLGVLDSVGPQLGSVGPQLARVGSPGAGIQLETADGGVVRMELVEEADSDAPETEIELRIDEMAKQEAVTEDTKCEVEVNGIKSTGKRSARLGLRCSVCARVLTSRSALRRHARTHSGERPYACPRCARSFAQKEVMRRHMLVHEEVRPHQCSQCSKSFTQRNALQAHERSHLPPLDRPLALHSCPHCPKLFLYSSGLSRHMMTHSGRVYECGACRRQFADRSSVLRHIRRANHVPSADDPAVGDNTQSEAET